ncbi:BON domain-containing protein [Nonomuraea sp. NPDC004702]
MLRVFTRSAAELETDVRAVLKDAGSFSVEADGGVVRISGRVRWTSQILALAEAVRSVEGVVEVVSEVAADHDD